MTPWLSSLLRLKSFLTCITA